MPGIDAEPGETLALVRLGGRMVDLEPADARPRVAQSAAVVAGPADHHLPQAGVDRVDHHLVKEGRALPQVLVHAGAGRPLPGRHVGGEQLVGRRIAVARRDPRVLESVGGDAARGMGRGAIFHQGHNNAAAASGGLATQGRDWPGGAVVELDVRVSESNLTLRPMTRAEWDEWMPRQMAGYAEHIAASGAMSEADAWDKARNDTARFFHAGFETPGMLVYRIMAGNQAAGWLWLAVPGPDPDRQMAWVFNIPRWILASPRARLRARGDAAGGGRGAIAWHDVAGA